MAYMSTNYALSRERATKGDVVTGAPDWQDLATELKGLPLPQYRMFPYRTRMAMQPRARPYHQFPTKHCLMLLARLAHFPATSHDMIALARRTGCNRATILFLKLFGLRDVFENGIDFLNRCKDVMMFLREERGAPHELLRSPAG